MVDGMLASREVRVRMLAFVRIWIEEHPLVFVCVLFVCLFFAVWKGLWRSLEDE